MSAGVKLTVKGRVQGVGYRWFVVHEAQNLGATGYVKNLYNGDVEVEAAGERSQLEALIAKVRKGPAFARVTEVIIEWKEFSGRYTSFTVEF